MAAKKAVKNVKGVFGVAVGNDGSSCATEITYNATKTELKALESLGGGAYDSYELEQAQVVDIHIFEFELTPPKVKPVKIKKLKSKKVKTVEQKTDNDNDGISHDTY